jgi:hypothetical protein
MRMRTDLKMSEETFLQPSRWVLFSLFVKCMSTRIEMIPWYIMCLGLNAGLAPYHRPKLPSSNRFAGAAIIVGSSNKRSEVSGARIQEENRK